jgi:transcriptional regulator with XRE-family HTH domain
MKLRISEVAQERGVSLAQLARRSGYSYTTVRRLWRGLTDAGKPLSQIDAVKLERIAAALSVPSSDLIEVQGKE